MATFAIATAGLLPKGEEVDAGNIKYGSTLSGDALPAQEFDFTLSKSVLRQKLEDRPGTPARQRRHQFRAGQQIEKALGLGGLDVLRYSGLPLLRRTDTVTHESWSWSG